MNGTRVCVRVDLLAPIQLNSTRVVIKGGYAVQFYVEEKCGNVREFVSTSCLEKPLTTKSSQLTRHTFWVNITGLKTSQHCVMVKATTVTEISSKYAVIEIALGRGRNEEGSLPSDSRLLIKLICFRFCQTKPRL